MRVGTSLVVVGTVCLMVVLVGVAVAQPAGLSAGDSNSTSKSPPPDPSSDRLGWEQGVWYNESIDVDQSDGLSETELQRYKARTMARLEVLRGLEFTEDVPIDFIGPAEVDERIDRDVTQFRGSAQQWEALFVIGERRNASRVLRETLIANVGGWAAEEGSDTVVLVTPDPETPTAPPRLMAHELVHVLQHQQFDLSADRYQRSTMDGEHAKDAVVEGEASYLDGLYTRACRNGTWNCVDGGVFATGPGRGEPKLRQYLGAPYSLGSRYIGTLVNRDGYRAVTAGHRDPPNSSVVSLLADRSIAPETPLSIPDRSDPGWNRTGTHDRVGAMGLQAFAPGVNRQWRNGVLYSYTNGSAGGFVWETTWASPSAAAGFAATYRDHIESEGGTTVGEHTWRIDSGPFADAFSINRTGETVRIVNAPTVGQLPAVHGGGQLDRSPTTTTDGEASTTRVSGDVSDSADPRTQRSTTDRTTTSSGDGPGFGVLAALVGLAVGCLGLRNRPSRGWGADQ